MAVLLGLFFAPAALAKGGASEQANEQGSNENAHKTPDQTPNDHPSGKDRTDKPTEGKPQGKSTSDPDADSNGGADKPGMDGGFDADKDGNNGCGNDDDFEDDNNGWCGGKLSAAGNDDEEDETEETEETQSASVLGVTLERTLAAEPPAVLSAQVAAAPTRAAPAGTLAATGQNLDVLAAIGVTLLALGSVCVAADRRRVVPIKVRVDS